MTKDLLTAVGLVLVIEGLLYALVPGQLKRMADMMKSFNDDQLRVGGASAVALGVVIVWLVKTAVG